MPKVETDSPEGLDAPAESDPATEGDQPNDGLSPVARRIKEVQGDGLKFTDKDPEPGQPEGGEEAPEEGEADEVEEEEGPDADDDGVVEDEGEVPEAPDEGEASDEELDEDEPEPEADTVEVEVPGRREGETEKIQVPADQEETVRRLANEGMRREEFNRQMSAYREDRAEVEKFVSRINDDPSGLILDSATEETRRQIVRDLLFTDDALREDIYDRLQELDTNPAALERERAEIRADRLERQDKVRSRQQEIDHALHRADAIISAVNELIPKDADDEAANAFFEDAVAYLEFVAERNPDRVSADTVSDLLGSRLRVHGLQAEPSAGDSTDDGAGSTSDEGPGSDEGSAALEKAKKGQEEVTKKARKRKKTSAAAPAGKGASKASGLSPPKGQNLSERMKWLRKKGLLT